MTHLYIAVPTKTRFYASRIHVLKRCLKCRGLKQGGKREEILKRVKDCIFSGRYRTLDSSIDDGKWFALKAIKENRELKGNNSVVSLPVVYGHLATRKTRHQ